MGSQSIPLIVVAGPTASGKSALALHLARTCGGEIVNCDSLQLYSGMDIGTAKPRPEERAAVPPHLFYILQPADVFNAGDYAARARDCVREIHRRGRLPVHSWHERQAVRERRCPPPAARRGSWSATREASGLTRSVHSEFH